MPGINVMQVNPTTTNLTECECEHSVGARALVVHDCRCSHTMRQSTLHQCVNIFERTCLMDTQLWKREMAAQQQADNHQHMDQSQGAHGYEGRT